MSSVGKDCALKTGILLGPQRTGDGYHRAASQQPGGEPCTMYIKALLEPHDGNKPCIEKNTPESKGGPAVQDPWLSVARMQTQSSDNRSYPLQSVVGLIILRRFLPYSQHLDLEQNGSEDVWCLVISTPEECPRVHSWLLGARYSVCIQ
ncbi:hypothetical protein U0070_006476 [Myodes glareolus]|uniref:Uncharacterized protein n=1 Tax=Myodes glareolus TaxID=447135 RepID=A0AAW0HSI0_MYOGA